MDSSDRSEDLRRVEQIQEWAYRKIGIDPDFHAKLISDSKYKKLTSIYDQLETQEEEYKRNMDLPDEDNPELIRKIDEYHEKYRTTRLQDPVIVARFYTIANELQNFLKLVTPEFKDLNRDPIIASLPLGMINGWSLATQSDCPCLMLSEGMRFSPLVISDFIFYSLTETIGDGLKLHGGPKGVKEREAQVFSKSLPLFSYLLLDASRSEIIGPQKEVINDFSNFENLSYTRFLVLAGFEYFVIAHELAHFAHWHFGLLNESDRNKVRGPLIGPSEIRINTTINTMKSKYPGISNITGDDLIRYGLVQFAEYQADITAILLIFYHLKNRANEDPAEQYYFLLGVFSFFWYAEFCERVHRLIRVGRDMSRDSLFLEDLEVQNLCLRSSHPAPLSRFKEIKKYITFTKSNPFVENALDTIESLFETAWTMNVSAIEKKVKEDGLKICEKKWGYEWPDSDVFAAHNVFGLERNKKA